MINTTDFQEVEVLLPGEWRREDNGDIYAFTVEKMKLQEERLFKQLLIRHAAPPTDPPAASPVDTTRWALTIKDDFCGLIIEDTEYIIRQIGRRKDEEIGMSLQDGPTDIKFTKLL